MPESRLPVLRYLLFLLEAVDSCLWEWRFFDDWKKQRLILLRKGNKPLEDASSYRPICLLDTMGKLLEELILLGLQTLLVRESGLSENHFRFRKGRSTVDSRGLKMAPEKIEVLLVTDRRSFQYPRIVLQKYKVV